MSENLPVAAQPTEMALSIEQLKGNVKLIQDVMRGVMHENEHFGIIPGCKKPSLWKPGAEKLSSTFRLAPYYSWDEKDLPRGHKEFVMKCTLKHIPTDKIHGEGLGSCSTMETKYRYRDEERKCPKCGAEAIIKGKEEFGGGWVCFKKKNGCGAKFADGDQAIEGQKAGRVEYDNPADFYNTALKMAKKRAHIDATLTVTAASDIFTQDLEDMVDNGAIKTEPETLKSANPPPPKNEQKPPAPKQPEFKPCTKTQFQAMQDLYTKTFTDYNEAHLKQIAAHFTKGERLSFGEAADLLSHWQARLDEYEESQTKKEEANA